MKKIKLSLIIPAFNEEKFLGSTLGKILAFLQKKEYTWEIIVVDDGSADKTLEVARKFKKQGIVIVRHDKNQGKGAAIRTGVSQASGEFIVFTDVDLSVPIETLDNLLAVLEGGSDVVVGSRRVKGAKILVHQPWLRENMGRFFTLLARIITQTSLSDFTCGFKGFRKDAAKSIFSAALLNRWAYDAEIIFLAKKKGYNIKELPVSWKNKEDTRVRLGIDTIVSLRDLLSIRVNDMLRVYDK